MEGEHGTKRRLRGNTIFGFPLKSVQWLRTPPAGNSKARIEMRYGSVTNLAEPNQAIRHS